MCLFCTLLTNPNPVDTFQAWRKELDGVLFDTPNQPVLEFLDRDCLQVWNKCENVLSLQIQTQPHLSVMGWALLAAHKIPVQRDILLQEFDSGNHSDEIADVLRWLFVAQGFLSSPDSISSKPPLHIDVETTAQALVPLLERLSDAQKNRVETSAAHKSITMNIFERTTSLQQHQVLTKCTNTYGQAAIRKI